MVETAEDAVGLGQQQRAGLGQADPPLRAIEQADAQLGLECLDLLAEARLSDVQPSRRATIVEFLSYGDEVAQVANFHRAES